MPCFLNAANEVLVDRFLKKQIRWSDIPRGLEKLCLSHKAEKLDSFSDVFEVDALARGQAQILSFNERVSQYDL
jgi:1-deoxy-D-xylulose-5-phosphate reductoisomerase